MARCGGMMPVVARELQNISNYFIGSCDDVDTTGG